MTKSFIIYFSVALLAVIVLWASKAAAAPSNLCPVVQLGTKQMKSGKDCTNACKKTFGELNTGARCLKKRRLEFSPEGLKFSCWCGCSIKKSKKKKCPPATVETPPAPPSDDDNNNDGGEDDEFVARKFLLY